MQVNEHVEALDEQGRLLLAAAGEAGLGAPVPTCPGWQVADLVAHIGGVHRWAASYLVSGRPGPVSPEEETELMRAPDGDELLPWAGQAHGALVHALRAASPSLQCWSFLPAASPLAFWARRQAHETAVHRIDAEAARGRRCQFGPAFAADGLGELLCGFFSRRGGRLRSEHPLALGVRLVDCAAAWTVTIGPEGASGREGLDGADCTVRGPASGMYQMMWNRLGPEAAGVEVDGDPAVLDLWQAKATVRWS